MLNSSKTSQNTLSLSPKEKKGLMRELLELNYNLKEQHKIFMNLKTKLIDYKKVEDMILKKTLITLNQFCILPDKNWRRTSTIF